MIFHLGHPTEDDFFLWKNRFIRKTSDMVVKCDFTAKIHLTGTITNLYDEIRKLFCDESL